MILARAPNGTRINDPVPRRHQISVSRWVMTDSSGQLWCAMESSGPGRSVRPGWASQVSGRYSQVGLVGPARSVRPGWSSQVSGRRSVQPGPAWPESGGHHTMAPGRSACASTVTAQHDTKSLYRSHLEWSCQPWTAGKGETRDHCGGWAPSMLVAKEASLRESRRWAQYGGRADVRPDGIEVLVFAFSKCSSWRGWTKTHQIWGRKKDCLRGLHEPDFQPQFQPTP